MLGSVVEYDTTRDRDPDGQRHWKRWALFALLSIAGVSFVSTRGCVRRIPSVKEPATAPEQGRDVIEVARPLKSPERPVASPEKVPPEQKPVVSAPVAPKPLTPEAREAARWLEAATERPAAERALLERLAVAEREGKLHLAIDSLERLRARPSMADLDDRLARRLGVLNMKFLLSGERTPWTAEAVVKRGDTLGRIAREHGTTVAALKKLNGVNETDRLSLGRRIRTLEYPRATLVVHHSTRVADLSLNGKFFRRYYLGPFAGAPKAGAYPITREQGPRTRFTALGMRFVPPDLAEIEMLLAPGSTLSVSDM